MGGGDMSIPITSPSSRNPRRLPDEVMVAIEAHASIAGPLGAAVLTGCLNLTIVASAVQATQLSSAHCWMGSPAADTPSAV
jgi:hypothetical protein